MSRNTEQRKEKGVGVRLGDIMGKDIRIQSDKNEKAVKNERAFQGFSYRTPRFALYQDDGVRARK